MLNTLKTLSLAVLLGSGPVQAADAPLKIAPPPPSPRRWKSP